jgi:hypothetical protein
MSVPPHRGDKSVVNVARASSVDWRGPDVPLRSPDQRVASLRPPRRDLERCGDGQVDAASLVLEVPVRISLPRELIDAVLFVEHRLTDLMRPSVNDPRRIFKKDHPCLP